MQENALIIFGESEFTDVKGFHEHAIEPKPAIRSCRYLENTGERNCTMGEWECEAGQWQIASHPHDELCVITEGEAYVTDSTGEHLFKKGDTFIIKKGISHQWKVPKYVKKVFAIVR